ncbi:unnamed protein product [Rhizophagus irregularis]|nr:unnamed protein product [Rhizophagus irregularis]
MILKYIYTGELDLTKQSGEDILGLLVSSDELLFDELFDRIQDYLIEKQTIWVQNYSVLVLNTVFQRPSYKKLQDYCLKSICENPEPFISSKMFPLLDKDILFGLLKWDDLQIREIDAWNCLIKWGIEQTPVRPYKYVIPNHIYEELEKFYYKKALPITTTLPPRTRKSGSLTSTIIKPGLANILSDWIDGSDIATNLNNDKYVFNLIYLMSRDGFDSGTFYNKCVGQGPFVVLVRTHTKNIYGGYNPIGYTGRNQWLSSTESFVFSFGNDQDMYNMKIGRVTNIACSIYDSPFYDCFFNFGNMLYVTNGQRLAVGYDNRYYRNIFGEKHLSNIEEIEVFSVSGKDC